MYYLDTSVLIPLYRLEALSEPAERLLDETATAPAISTLTRVEVASVLSRCVRTGELEADQAREIERSIAADLDAVSLVQLPFGDSSYWQARYWLGRYDTKLHTLDALHLACAAEHGLTLVTGDRALSNAAAILGASTHLLDGSD